MTKSNDSRTSDPKFDALVDALGGVLRPLVGLLIENRITFPWLSGFLKTIFVDVANREFRIERKQQTDSRITLLTGVHRKDIRRLRTKNEYQLDAPDNVYLGAQLVAVWSGDKRFLDSRGKPRALNRVKRDSRDLSFEDLVSSVSRDIGPRAVLDELLRLGVVDLTGTDKVRLRETAYVPSKGFEEKIFYLGANVHDHLAAARANVNSDDPPFLERSVYYGQLSEESVGLLNAYCREESVKLLVKVNKKAQVLQQRDRKKKWQQFRMNFGVYFFSEGDDPTSENSD